MRAFQGRRPFQVEPKALFQEPKGRANCPKGRPIAQRAVKGAIGRRYYLLPMNNTRAARALRTIARRAFQGRRPFLMIPDALRAFQKARRAFQGRRPFQRR